MGCSTWKELVSKMARGSHKIGSALVMKLSLQGIASGLNLK